MAKRKLNRRQAWRIRKIQEERIARAQRHEGEQEPPLLRETDLGPEQEGLIIAHYGTQVEVETLASGERHSTERAHQRANLEPLVTGDRVIWQPGAGTGVVVARLPRRSELLRPDTYGVLKPVAANIDQVVVVIAARPPPHPQMLDRYLVASAAQDLEALLVLNKCDLLDDTEQLVFEQLLAPYADLGYTVVRTSTLRPASIARLGQTLTGRTCVFTGQSGVGKSSLINALLPGADAATGELSASTGKGRHTTTTARLFHFAAGGVLIDSPGVRDFSLAHLDRHRIALGFPEFRPHLGRCKFRDCQHRNEPACALIGAVTSGQISPRRLASYHHLVGSLDDS